MRGHRRGLAIVAVSLVFAAPFVLLVLGSLQRPGLPPPDGFALWPDQPSWRN
jgi:multiple sugar transport system permease protein